tara:strand:+ start:372 stop:509 length:138 start_codon:yes stop_codon:yes gene_type:complete
MFVFSPHSGQNLDLIDILDSNLSGLKSWCYSFILANLLTLSSVEG